MLELEISQLLEYAVQKFFLADADRIWASNLLLEALHLNGFDGLQPVDHLPSLSEILSPLNQYAFESGLIQGNTPAFTDLFDTKLMGLLMPRPSEVIQTFQRLFDDTPEQATTWYYNLSQDSNYIRRDRIEKDVKWGTQTEYGMMDITINLSKPEKDPRAIAAAGATISTDYPKCQLCRENEGYAGRLDHPARQNHRIIPIKLAGKDYFLQYSPYVYYNEHCIVFNREHTPMAIDHQCFTHLLDFVSLFPHYFVGSNADLPIVGGSILSHDHYQGGRYSFAMDRAPIEHVYQVPGFEDLTIGRIKWPVSVLRVKGSDKSRIVAFADHVLASWRNWSDPEAEIYAHTDAPHNTLNPIARREDSDYVLDLALRNNRTTEAFPLGLFHPHLEKHHIKKENIGLIEVMGLAILPARLKEELALLADCVRTGADPAEFEKTALHAAWYHHTVLPAHPELNAENAPAILQQEVGKVFAAVLEDAGVFKRTPPGFAAFDRFVSSL